MSALGILKADTVGDQLRSRFGDYSDMYRELFDANLRNQLTFRVYDVTKQEYPETIDECDGYLITGSRRSAYDQEPWVLRLLEFIDELHESRKKTIGICFGHQCIAHALGGQVEAAENGWGAGVHEYSVTDPEVVCDSSVNSIQLICSHQDQVTRMPSGASSYLTSEFCPLAGFVIEDHMITLQGHPEFSREFAENIFQSRKNALGSRFKQAMSSLSLETDAATVAEYLYSFLSR